MDDTTRLITNAKIQLPGALDGTIQLELFNVIDEFCRTTHAWRQTIDLDLSTTQSSYPIVADAGTAIVDIFGITWNGRQMLSQDGGGPAAITLTGPIQADDINPDNTMDYNPDDIGSSSGLITYAVFDPSMVTLAGGVSSEMATEPLRVYCSLTPTDDNQNKVQYPVPDGFFARYHQVLLEGVLGRMMGHIAKPYSSERMAIYHLKRFRNLMANATRGAKVGHVYGGQAWRFPRHSR